MNSRNLVITMFLAFAIVAMIVANSFEGQKIEKRSISVSAGGKLVSIQYLPKEKADLISIDDAEIKINPRSILLNGEKVAEISLYDHEFTISLTDAELSIKSADKVVLKVERKEVFPNDLKN